MKSFVLNRHGALVFPSSSFAEPDFSVLTSLAQFEAIIRRDAESKAPKGADIVARIEAGGYATRLDLLRDVALNLCWVNRFALTMYEKRPTRWRDVPRLRDDVFLSVMTPWPDGDRKVAAVGKAYDALPSANPKGAEAEDRIFALLYDVFRNKRHHATTMPPIKPTIAEFLAGADNATIVIDRHEPDFARFSDEEIIDVREEIPELEAIHRWAMVLHNQYPWDRSRQRLARPGEIGDDEFVVVFAPRNREVLDFIRRVKAAEAHPPAPPPPRKPVEPVQPIAPYPPTIVARDYKVQPRLEALAALHGEQPCTNEDLIRNAASSWSPMSAEEILDKTGIEARCYTARDLEDIALDAARAALAKSGRKPEEIGALLFCSCTSTQLIPAVATWLSAELGIYQTHNSSDIVAACAGMSYGLSEAVRLLQEVKRPVLLVCAEKFSDKIGNVRTSRMLFGDAAAAMVIAPSDGETDIAVLNTYASGPQKEVNAIIWPNPDFDNNITVYGPPVRNLAQRYLTQMLDELRAMPGLRGGKTALDEIDLVVPHQANKTMVTELAIGAGLSPEHLYFNIEQVGNTSSASIPLAIHDAVIGGVIDRPMWLFAPGFGAGAVGGYAVIRVDPAIVTTADRVAVRDAAGYPQQGSSSADVQVGFGQ